MAKFKYKYAKATERDISIQKHFRDRYADRTDICKYVELDLLKGAPDGYYLHRKSKYNHVKYLCIDGLCTKTSEYYNTNDPFRPQPIFIFMIDKDMRESLVKCYNYLTEQMQYEVRCYINHENARKLNKVNLRINKLKWE